MKSHRGLSSVVGAVFLIAIVIGALSYITYSLETMGNFSEALITEESRLKEKSREVFEITSIDITAANKLDGVIKNTGEIPVEIKSLYIDEQGVNDVVQKFTLDTKISQGNTANLVDMVDYTMDPTKGYNMKIISSRGEAKSFYVNSASQENIDISLFAIPETLVTGFDATLLMTVVNNMTNNNILVNLTPEDPYPGCSSDSDCTLVSGPDPASYDVLKSGDIAIFKWSYLLSGKDGDFFSFTGAIQNSNPGNDDSKTVTIDVPLYAENSGVSLESVGFGQTSQVNNIFVLHSETFGTPSDDYQLSPLIPDASGTLLTFNDISDSFKFFSANVTGTDAHFPAGVWDASLRYNHDALPSNLSMDYIGLNLHFEDTSPSTGLYDSGTNPSCYNLAEAGTNSGVSGVTWYPDRGVNGSAAYYFDGSDARLTIQIDDKEAGCLNVHHNSYSVSGWFNATRNDSYHAQQWIYSLWDDVGDGGGFSVYLGDGTIGNHGRLYFAALEDEGGITLCSGDEPDGDEGVNYMDNEWHHFVGTASATACNLYIDGNFKDTNTGAEVGHWDIGSFDEDHHIGADRINNYDFTGYIDDIMFWYDTALTSANVTALKEYSFGYGATEMDFLIGNYTDVGTLLDTIVDSQDYPMKWGDPGHYTDDSDLYRGGNYTVSIPDEVRLNLLPDANRLGFTMTYADGEPLYFNLDDTDIGGGAGVLLSSYLQPPSLVEPQILPVYYAWQNTNEKVHFFAFSSGNEGAWFTNQGTRIIFNGTNGNYAGLIDTVGNGVDTPVILNATSDSPFIARNTPGDFVFWAPQASPTKAAPDPGDEVPVGNYDVSVFLSGYDEDGTVFIRSVSLGTIAVE